MNNKATIDLFSPLDFGSFTLRNRMVMAPMTRNRAGDGNVPQAMTAEYYRQRASAGLIITEATQVSAEGVDYDQIRQRFQGRYMANLGYDLTKAQAAIANGHADLVSFGALYLANPDLVERFKAGAELNVPDQASFYGGDEHGYTDYPFMET